MYGGELSPGLMSLDRRQRRACTRVLEQLIHDFCHPVLLDRASHWCSQPEFGHALCPARWFVLGWPGRRPGHLVPRWSLSHWEARVHHLLCDVSCQVLTKAAPRLFMARRFCGTNVSKYRRFCVCYILPRFASFFKSFMVDFRD